MATQPKTTPAAAQAEVAEKVEPKVAEWRELKLELPDELPPTILFDLTELEASEDPMPVFRLLRSILGPAQFAVVRNAVTDEDDLSVLVDDITGVIFGQYGISLGE